jgi:hypothetical protein
MTWPWNLSTFSRPQEARSLTVVISFFYWKNMQSEEAFATAIDKARLLQFQVTLARYERWQALMITLIELQHCHKKHQLNGSINIIDTTWFIMDTIVEQSMSICTRVQIVLIFDWALSLTLALEIAPLEIATKIDHNQQLKHPHPTTSTRLMWLLYRSRAKTRRRSRCSLRA